MDRTNKFFNVVVNMWGGVGHHLGCGYSSACVLYIYLYIYRYMDLLTLPQIHRFRVFSGSNKTLHLKKHTTCIRIWQTRVRQIPRSTSAFTILVLGCLRGLLPRLLAFTSTFRNRRPSSFRAQMTQSPPTHKEPTSDGLQPRRI